MKTMVITGGSRGIGAGLVRRFSSGGWRVVFCWSHSEETAKAITYETGALRFKADVASETDVIALFEFAKEQLGHIDAVIINAGVSFTGLLSEMKAEEWDNLFAVNVRGAFLCAREALRRMLPCKKGSLVFISSIWGINGASCEVAYSASKAALIGMTRALAKETAPSSIRINCVAPGCVNTDMLSGLDEDEKTALAGRTPLGRLGSPSDISGAVEFLLSESASFITGQTLTVDGGFIL